MFPVSIFLVLILSFLMVYPSSYHSDIISECFSWGERKGQQKQGWDISDSCHLYGEKEILPSDVVGWWCCDCHPAYDGKGEWFSLFPKGALTGFVSFPLQVHSTAASLQPGGLVSGFCTFCSGLCDRHCCGEEISITVQPVYRWREGLQCTRHCANYSED